MGTNPAVDAGQLESLLGAVVVFGDDHKKYVSSPMVQAVGKVMEPLLGEAILRGVRRLLEELEASPKDAEGQWMGLYLFRRFLWGSTAVRELVMAHKHGVLQLLARTSQHHQNDLRLQGEVMWLLFEVGGLTALLDMLSVCSHSSALVRMCIRQIKERCQVQSVWWEWVRQPWERSLMPVLRVMEAHKHDAEIMSEALWFLQEFIWDAGFRDAFGSRGGWSTILTAMEAQLSCPAVQLAGCRAIVGLGSRGGAWGVQWESRAAAALGNTIKMHSKNEDLLRWAFWALKEVHGVGALLEMLQNSPETLEMKTSIAIFNALSELPWGQADALDLGAACQVVERCSAWLRQGGTWQSSALAMPMQAALGNAARFAAPSQPPADVTPLSAQCAQAVGIAAETFLWILRERLSDASMAEDACTRLAEIHHLSPASASVKALVKQGLVETTSPADGGVSILQRLAAAHVSNGDLQKTVLWTMGVVYGPRPVLEHMAHHMASQEVQLHAVKSLGCLYDEDEEDCLANEINAARADALRAVVHTMTKYPDNMLLCQHCCFAMSVIVIPGARVGLDDPAFLQLCLQAILHVVRVADGYPEKEACRAIISLVPALLAVPNAVAALREDKGARAALEHSVQCRFRWAPWERRRAEESDDGVDAAEHEEGLSLALTALGLVAGVEPVVATLEKGAESGKPSVIKAAAQTIVDLARLGAEQAISEHQASLSTAFRRCFEKQLDVQVMATLELAAGFFMAATKASQAT